MATRCHDPKIARVILVEAGERILPSFDAKLASRVVRDLESLGVQVWTKSLVTDLDGHFVTVGEERIKAGTVLWAAGVQASMFHQKMDVECDASGRIIVQLDLRLPGDPTVQIRDWHHAIMVCYSLH